MPRRLLLLSTLVLLAAACESADQEAEDRGPAVQYLMANPNSGMPFSDAVRIDEFLILSGQIGTDSTGALAEGGIAAETRQTLENIKSVLERNGSSLNQVVKCTAMLADMSEWPAMNEVYVTYFTEHLPARSAFGASGLALGAKIELECWAVIPESETD